MTNKKQMAACDAASVHFGPTIRKTSIRVSDVKNDDDDEDGGDG